MKTLINVVAVLAVVFAAAVYFLPESYLPFDKGQQHQARTVYVVNGVWLEKGGIYNSNEIVNFFPKLSGFTVIDSTGKEVFIDFKNVSNDSINTHKVQRQK
jgi:hypothetical protein